MTYAAIYLYTYAGIPHTAHFGKIFNTELANTNFGYKKGGCKFLVAAGAMVGTAFFSFETTSKLLDIR